MAEEHVIIKTPEGEHIAAKFAITIIDGHEIRVDSCLWSDGWSPSTNRIVEDFARERELTLTSRFPKEDQWGGGWWYQSQIVKAVKKYWKDTHA